MLYNLIAPLSEQFILANLFRYLTFRAGAACITALVLSLLFGPALIRTLRAIQRQGQPIRPDGPERHLIEKKGTPASPATARASKVFPVPGGPTSSTPLGMRAPNRLYRFGSFRKLMISCSSSLASSTPATSSNVVLTPVST